MKYSQLFIKTQRELPAQEESKNAELLIRAGFIHKEMAGVYSYLPLGLRVLEKIKTIVREEMNRVGAMEILMPAFASKENWERTCRWDSVDVLYKLEMSSGKEVALAPTHEETVTPLVQYFCRSHKDFPMCVYQIQDKFRNEPRAKSGLLRGREFWMKDAYSFHTSQEDFEAYYEKMKEVYMTVYKRLGIGDITHITAASGGDFSKFSHEFQTISEVGEDMVFYDTKTGEYFNREIVPSQAPAVSYQDTEMLPRKDVEGKGIVGVEALADFLKIPVEKTTKTMLFETDTGKVVAAAVRGGYNISELKLKEVLGCKMLKLASSETVQRVTKAEVGYAGILDLPDEVETIMDESCKGRMNFETGANRTDYHTINANFGRDIPEPKQFYDIKVANSGDINPDTGEIYEISHAIEVGNIFPLSTKFSDAFRFTATDEQGKNIPVIMGCYGIGISRLMGVLVEVFHDDRGIQWPKSVSPYQVYLAPIGRDQSVYTRAEKLYEDLQNSGIEVFYDNRQDKKIGPGQKFADHELMGIPLRIVVSERTLEKNEVEWVERKSGKTQNVSFDDLKDNIRAFCHG